MGEHIQYIFRQTSHHTDLKVGWWINHEPYQDLGDFNFLLLNSNSNLPPFWFDSSPPSAAYMCQWLSSALLVAYSAPGHYLNKCWVIVNWTLRNKLKWNFNQNTKLFIHENVSENIVYEMAAILSWGRWVKPSGWCVSTDALFLCVLL